MYFSENMNIISENRAKKKLVDMYFSSDMNIISEVYKEMFVQVKLAASPFGSANCYHYL